MNKVYTKNNTLFVDTYIDREIIYDLAKHIDVSNLQQMINTIDNIKQSNEKTKEKIIQETYEKK